MSNLREAIIRQASRGGVFLRSIAKGRPARLAVAGLTAAALLAATACDQGFTVESSPDGGESGTTPAVAFKTPRTKAAPEVESTPTPEVEESPTAEAEESPPAEEATPTSAPTTEAAETEAPTTETPAAETPTPEPAEPTPTATVERTLVPAEETPAGEAEDSPGVEISPEMQAWIVEILQDLTAGRTAVRPFEFDPGLEVTLETNNLARFMPAQFIQNGFDSKIRSAYFVQAGQIVDWRDPAQTRRPTYFGEIILVHESEADAASFSSEYRSFAISLLGSFSDQFVQSNFPDATGNLQEDAGFGIAEEEFILVGEFDLGLEGPPIRPQVYIMTGRQGNVNFALLVLFLDSQSRMRPFALLDRLVSRIG